MKRYENDFDEIEAIKDIRELLSKKNNVEKKLLNLKQEIELKKDQCLHGIHADFGYEKFPDGTGEYVCLICGKIVIDYQKSDYIIHAEKYLPKYDINNPEEYGKKLDDIQTIMIGVAKDNPYIERKELVQKLNNLIEESINKREENYFDTALEGSKTLLKKHGFTKKKIKVGD